MAKSRIDRVVDLVWKKQSLADTRFAMAQRQRDAGDDESADLNEEVAREARLELSGIYQVLDILGWTEKVNERV